MSAIFPRLAVRNILRNARRSLIAALAVVSGMASVIVFGGFVSYTYYALREQTIHSQLGHINVVSKSNTGTEAEPSFFSFTPSLRHAITSIPEVTVVTGRITFSSLISTGERTVNCLANGITPEDEKDFFSSERMISGKPLASSGEDGIVLGQSLAENLQASVGTVVTLLTTTPAGMINASDLTVVGVARVGSKEYDRVYARVPLTVAQRLLQTKDVQRIVVLLRNTRSTDVVADTLRRRFQSENQPLAVQTWSEMADFYNAVVNLYNGIFAVVAIIVSVLFLFGIANTMTMAVFERVREIGTLRAIGTRRSWIVRLFLWEGLLFGSVVGAGGLLAGIATAQGINLLGGIYIPPPPGMSEGYQAYITVEPLVLFGAYLGTVVVAILSSAYPALKAARLNVVDALAHI